MNIVEDLHARANRTILIVSLVATVVFSVVMLLVLLPQMTAVSGGLLPLDMRVIYTPEEASSLFMALGEEGILLYQLFQLCDTGFPISLAVTLSSCIALVNNAIFPNKNRLRLAVMVPFITAVFDYAENALIWSQLLGFPTLSPQVFLLSYVMSSIKLILLVISVGLTLLLVTVYVWKRRYP